jgi:hypothetical protein
MHATTTHRRTLVATAVLTATWLTLAVPAADAAPKPSRSTPRAAPPSDPLVWKPPCETWSP